MRRFKTTTTSRTRHRRAKGAFAYTLDGSGRRISGPLERGGAVLVAQISPDGSKVATLELLGEFTPPPITAPPGTSPTLGLHPYLFTQGPDGSGRAVVARDVVDTASLGDQLARSDKSSQPPFARGICPLAVNMGFACGRDLARDLTSDLSAPALSPDGRRLAFNRGGDIYVIATDGSPGSERRIIRGGIQPVWIAAGVACPRTLSTSLSIRGREVTVRTCAPSAGRLTVTLKRGSRRVARRTVSVMRGGFLTVHFARPPGTGPLRAIVSFRAT